MNGLVERDREPPVNTSKLNKTWLTYRIQRNCGYIIIIFSAKQAQQVYTASWDSWWQRTRVVFTASVPILSSCFYNMFVCLFVGINPEKLYSTSCLEGSKPPGSGHTRAEAQTTTCIPKTAAQTTYLLCFKYIYIYILFFGWESSQLACRVQPKRAQVEVQYWRNPEVARLEDTPTMDLGHMNVVLKWMYLYVASVFRMWNVVLKWCICMLRMNVRIGIICSFTSFFFVCFERV